ncbi:MAG TPA: TonB-dependent receptor, partial [Chitinophagaceae bacterium]|nr:TonB-dependent receptor [Chitinophagaceae bacterium]
VIVWMIPFAVLSQFKNEKNNSTINQDNINLSGKVIDEKTRQPLEGASIHIQGTTHTVITNINGEFKFITGQKLPVVYIVNYVGYEDKKIQATVSDIIIGLKEAGTSLNEVAVIGYGTQKRRDITGSVATLPKENLSRATSSLDNLLTGAISGVAVTQSSAQPGSTSSIRIRGGNSLSFGNDPLFVIDGFIYYNDNSVTNFSPNAGTSVTGVSSNALATINPNDIESIDVLKDASATAIYGSRGANGVIIITTKKGNRNSNDLSYSGSYGIQNVTKKLAVLNGTQWANYFDDLYNATPLIQAGLANNKKLIDSLGASGINGDWVGAAVKTGSTQNHQLSIYGGDEKSRYSISGNYFNQDGTVINTNFKRFSARVNYEKNISSQFKIAANVFGSNSNQNKLTGSGYNGINFGNAFSSLNANNPLQTVYNLDGTYNTAYAPAINPTYNIINGKQLGDNSIQDIANTINETKLAKLLGNFSAEYKIVKDVVFKTTFGADILNTKLDYYAPSYTAAGNSTGTITGSGSVANINSLSWLNENTITYDHTFKNEHSINVLAGYTTQYQKVENSFISGQSFPSDATTYNNLWSASANKIVGSGEATSTRNSWLGRVSYSFRHRYNFTVSGRADGASVLGSSNKWGFFPAVGFSWNALQEDFLKNYNHIFSNLKLRLTAGSVGNSNIPPYSSLSTLSTYNVYLGNPLNGIAGLAPSQLANPDLTWETTTQYNIGVDAGLFKNKINITFDAYYKKTTNLLIQGSGLVPLSSGYVTVSKNIGSLENKGIELSINSENIKTRNFTWKSNFIFATNANKILSLGPSQSYQPIAPTGQVSPVIVKVGLPVSTFWGYSTAGLITAQDASNAIPVLAGVSQQVGDRKYLHATGITSATITTADKHNLGSALPKYTASLSNNFKYNNFDLSVFFQGSFGNKIFNLLQQQLEKTTTTANVSTALLDRWNATTNPNGKFPKVVNAPVVQVQDTYIEDGSYIRLKNIVLGYNFSSKQAAKIFAKQLRVYASAENILTITKYSGLDPEANYYDQNNLQQGIDYGVYPNVKTFTVGVNVTF